MSYNYPVSNFNFTCLPGQGCWGLPEQWNAFNNSIGGRLKVTTPWAAPCYSDSSCDACKRVNSRYTDGLSRTSQYGAMEFLDWEICGQDNCLLGMKESATQLPGSCSLGRLSAYYVEAQSPDDIAKTLLFGQEHDIRISIKNTGHDYFGRSNTANSLAIWTHNMKNMEFYKAFQPKECDIRYEYVGEIGAGVQAEEAYTYFENMGMYVTVGAVGSVGIAGGFGQGGGHGPLGPTFGLMIDNAIEFDVITADGQFRTINECIEPDLFWAMRGGGGGTFAVLVNYRFQLHSAVPLNVYSFSASFPPTYGELNIRNSNLHRDILTALATDQPFFSANGIAGYNFLLPDHMVSLQIHPSKDTEAIKKITAQWHNFLSTYPGLEIRENSYHMFPNYTSWASFSQQPWIAKNGPVGVGIAEAGRFIPRKLFQSEETISTLVDAVVDAMEISYASGAGGSAQLYATGPANHPDNSKTGTNPGWRDALWHVIMGGFWTKDVSVSTRKLIQSAISSSITPLKNITPGGGCYMNEGDWTEMEWQTTFFGGNYEGLERVKRKWDPRGLFNCWKCVGWTGYDDPGYSCYGQSTRVPVATVPLKALQL
ncbi:FAD-binding domain-containing protein [Delitschia confertaspora ATCC 74209]|uniref:FAD-binding domain-containing protein n=1 Tax=Delitschia confertaspora ATCC 74209 TaxID=1513339 RepID=A0A9P4JIU1_9PLEO|nr:FAD-binding domain-containing protein [Delitschia confertaspora ATCC 74209]